jgi:hypothetical protein
MAHGVGPLTEGIGPLRPSQGRGQATARHRYTKRSSTDLALTRRPWPPMMSAAEGASAEGEVLPPAARDSCRRDFKL